MTWDDATALLATALCQAVPCTRTAIPQNAGVTSIGPLADTGDSLYMNGSQVFTNALGGQVRSISIYIKGPLDSNANNRKFQVAIYDDNGGTPGHLLGQSVTGTLVANAWNTLPVIATLAPNTPYWLVANNNGRGDGVNVMVYATQNGNGIFSANSTPFGTWPVNFGQAVFSTMKFSIFMTLLPPQAP